MLNRTNRTLSANPNRLNLGTRTLALLGGNNNGLTLRTAHPFPTVAVRAGFIADPRIQRQAPPIQAMPKPLKPEMPAMPGSSSEPERPSRGYRAWERGQAESPSRLRPSSMVHPRSTLGWHCDRARRAGRSARAAWVLVTGATPAS